MCEENDNISWYILRQVLKALRQFPDDQTVAGLMDLQQTIKVKFKKLESHTVSTEFVQGHTIKWRRLKWAQQEPSNNYNEPNWTYHKDEEQLTKYWWSWGMIENNCPRVTDC